MKWVMNTITVTSWQAGHLLPVGLSSLKIAVFRRQGSRDYSQLRNVVWNSWEYLLYPASPSSLECSVKRPGDYSTHHLIHRLGYLLFWARSSSEWEAKAGKVDKKGCQPSQL